MNCGAGWHTPRGLQTICDWARCGLGEKEIAARMGLQRRELQQLKKEDPALAAAVAGEDRTDREIELALFRKAVGRVVEVRKPVKCKRAEFGETGRKTAEVEELVTGVEEAYVPPDLNALMYWLSHRCPERWGEQPMMQAEESGGGCVILPAAEPTEPEEEE